MWSVRACLQLLFFSIVLFSNQNVCEEANQTELDFGSAPDALTRLFAAFITEEVTPFSAKLLCEYSPGLNEAQRNVCMEYPAAMAFIQEIADAIHDECIGQFKNDRWNCTEVIPPIIGDPDSDLRRSTKESAFMHALTSAATVHVITKACSDGRIINCGCDTRFNGQETQQGWQWGGCSDDVEFGANFAHMFLDVRETENIEEKSHAQLGLSLVNLHNNAAGRKEVQDEMDVECTCHGISGSCSVRTCWRKLPELHSVSKNIKKKFDQSIKVSLQVQKDEPPSLKSVGDDPMPPSTSHLVFLKKSKNMCLYKQNYTLGRSCVPQNILTQYHSSGIEPLTSVDLTLAPCEDLCCGGEYSLKRTVAVKSCNCRFVWCCDIICDDCAVTVDTYKCTS